MPGTRNSKPTPAAITHALLHEQSLKIAQLAIDVSTALNEIQDIKHHLYNDNNTNGIGAIERSKLNEKKIAQLEQREAVYIAKWVGAAGVAGTFGGIIVWFVNKFLIR